MALPLLSDFLTQAPDFSQSDPLLLVAEALGKGLHDFGVVLTDERRLVGLIRASRLLGYLLVSTGGYEPHGVLLADGSHQVDLLGQGLLPTLADYPSWVEPILLAAADQPLASWATALPAAALPTAALPTNSIWAVVDAQQRYLGLLDWKRALPVLIAGRYQDSLARSVPGESEPFRAGPQTVGPLAQLELSGLPSAKPAGPDGFWGSLPEALVPRGLLAKPLLAAIATPPVNQSSGSAATNSHHRGGSHDPRATWLLELNHEIKSPLTSLLGLSTLLQDPRLGSLTPRQAHYARLLYQTTRRLVSTVNQLLDWFRLDAGQLTLFPAVIDTADLGPQVLRLLRSQAGPQESAASALENHFTWSLEPDLPAFVADSLRLRQMVYHLVSRALGPGEMPYRCGLRVECWDRWLSLAVWDDGPCPDAAVQAQLLQDRYRAAAEPASTDLSSPERTGLGLILAWHLARLHGGDLSFIASPQRGSRFTLLLPLVSPEAAAAGELGAAFAAFSEVLSDYPTPVFPKKPVGSANHDPVDSAACKQPNGTANASSAASRAALILLASTTIETIAAVALALEGSELKLVVARSQLELADKARRLSPALLLIDAASSPFYQVALPHLLAALPRLLISDGACPPPFTAAERLSPSRITNQLVPLVRRRLAAPHGAGSALGLTVLYLGEMGSDRIVPWSFSSWLHDYHCRVLEVDDLTQAEVLCRVWKPQVILLDPTISRPEPYLNRLAQLPTLKDRPLVTVTPQQLQAARQFPQLALFPCLANLDLQSQTAASQLMESLVRAAAGIPLG